MPVPNLRNKPFQTFLKNENVYHFVTYNETKAQGVERLNRTLKQLMWLMFTTSSSYHYLNRLDDLVNSNYNQTLHRSIKMNLWMLTRIMHQRSGTICTGFSSKCQQSINLKWEVKSRSVSINASFKRVTHHPGRRKPSLSLRDLRATRRVSSKGSRR